MASDESPHASAAELPAKLRVGDLTVDLDRRSVRRGKEPLDLTDRSFRLLESLLRHAPEVVSKDQLIAEVWDDAVVSDETLAQRVRLLRQSLGDESQNPRYVASVRGRGYRLVSTATNANTTPGRPRGSWAWFLGAAVLLSLAIGWKTLTGPGPVEQSPKADVLAVLPFVDLSADAGHQYFADGMQEELLSQLAAIDGLSIISRTSVERYRGTETGLPEIADQLGADAVIEGSVRVDADRMRVTVQLIDGTSDEHIWAENFDRRLSMQDIFELQSEVASQVAEALRLEYADFEAPATGLPTDNIQAYDLYLLGRYHTFKQTREDLATGVTYLEQAIEIDPEFASAYASLGWAYSFLGSEYGAQLPEEMYPKAKEAALRALALDDSLPDARSLYADILTWYDWDFAAAEREYQKSMELDPLNVLGYALFLSTQTRHEEALVLIERRLDAHPNDPYVRINAGWRYLNAGLTDKAIEAALAASEHPDSHSLLAISKIAQGDTAGAVQVREAAVESQGRTPRNVAHLAAAYFLDGRRSDAEPLLDELLELADQAYVAPALLAFVHFAAGDADSGFALLEAAFDQRSRDMIFLTVNEYLRNYRNDPRYLSLVERVGLP